MLVGGEFEIEEGCVEAELSERALKIKNNQLFRDLEAGKQVGNIFDFHPCSAILDFSDHPVGCDEIVVIG